MSRALLDETDLTIDDDDDVGGASMTVPRATDRRWQLTIQNTRSKRIHTLDGVDVTRCRFLQRNVEHLETHAPSGTILRNSLRMTLSVSGPREPFVLLVLMWCSSTSPNDDKDIMHRVRAMSTVNQLVVFAYAVALQIPSLIDMIRNMLQHDTTSATIMDHVIARFD